MNDEIEAQAAISAWPIPIAHRGGAQEFDENTVAAFEGSYEAGLRMFETDVRRTSDGVLVIMHDETVTRTTGVEGAIESMTLAAVRELRTLKAKAAVPLLDDLLDFFKGKPIMLHVELKSRNADKYPDSLLPAYFQQIHRAITAKLPLTAFRYTSFDERSLSVMRGVAPETELVYLNRQYTPESIATACRLEVPIISCSVANSERPQVELAKQAGLVAAGYGAHTIELFQKAGALGVAYTTTDIPIAISRWLAKQR